MHELTFLHCRVTPRCDCVHPGVSAIKHTFRPQLTQRLSLRQMEILTLRELALRVGEWMSGAGEMHQHKRSRWPLPKPTNKALTPSFPLARLVTSISLIRG